MPEIPEIPEKRDVKTTHVTIIGMAGSRSSRIRKAVGVTLLLSAALLVSADAWKRASGDMSAKDAQLALEASLDLARRETSESQDGHIPETLAPERRYEEGEAVGSIKSAGGEIDAIFVMGTSDESLSKGPGIFVSSAMPGAEGNTAIAGHRTSHGAPFRYIDKIVEGEEIALETAYGTFKYRVNGVKIVGPKDVRVLSDREGTDLTLIACHPLHSTKQRIVVTAEMVQ